MKQFVKEIHSYHEMKQQDENSLVPFGNDREVTIAEQINADLAAGAGWTVHSITPIYNYGGNEDGHLGKTSALVVYNTNESDVKLS